jgi:hypothetical protein
MQIHSSRRLKKPKHFKLGPSRLRDLVENSGGPPIAEPFTWTNGNFSGVPSDSA